jgi:hypothetical protein
MRLNEKNSVEELLHKMNEFIWSRRDISACGDAGLPF